MSNPQFKIYRETALPTPLQPASIYVVAPTGVENYVEVYVTNSAGTQARRIINQTDVQSMINAAMSAVQEIVVVADIAARNALAPTSTRYVYVRNATADATVASGGATYLYDVANTEWVKTSESESLDVVLSWNALQGKPNSTPTAIDAAVGMAHTHGNKTQLDKIGEDAGGNLTYGGAAVATQWSSNEW